MTSSKFKKLISLSFVFGLFGIGAATAQVIGPEEFFHRGATNYIFGQMQQAKAIVEAGLREYTNDFKLKSLYEKLKQKEQQNQQQQSKDEQSKNDKKEEQKSESKPESKDESKQDEQQQQDQAKKERSEPQDQRQSEKKDAGQAQQKDQQEQPEDQDSTASKPRVIQMTPQEAQRLLDALKSEEKAMIFIPPRTNRANPILKDW